MIRPTYTAETLDDIADFIEGLAKYPGIPARTLRERRDNEVRAKALLEAAEIVRNTTLARP